MARTTKLMAARLKLTVSSWVLTLLVTAYILVIFNGTFFRTVYELNGLTGFAGVLYIGGIFLFLLALLNLCLSLAAFPWLLKPVLVVLLVSSSIACYFMFTYNILIDTTMIQNVMETDIAESTELFSPGLFGFVFFTGILPAILVSGVSISYGRPIRFILTKACIGVTTVLVTGAIALLFYQDYASLFRNNRYIRDLIVPVNYIHALNAYSQKFFPENIPEFQTIGLDAHLDKNWVSNEKRKVVTVLVVGETARSANFSLFDYGRTTNPELAGKDTVNFRNVSSCGTSTAVSLPCMFSRLDKEHYDENTAKYSENVLDVLQRAGLKVVWIDNNSGCKDVCSRVGNEKIEPDSGLDLCTQDDCFDMILLDKLAGEIESSAEQNLVVVLHQKGSHGPAYYLRTPETFQSFKPFCNTNQLQECTQTEITNAYDNTILYTDHVLASVINYLDSHSDTLDSSMIYISDHGESLGENNIYLHGLPYFLAPDEQTHVPLIVWMGQHFSERFEFNKTCLEEKSSESLSHDNLFDSLLGLLHIQTSAYEEKNDFFHSCSSSRDYLSYHTTASNHG